MKTFKGLVFVKHGRVGSRSEGPDYYLQTTTGDFLLHFQTRLMFQPDYHLEFYCRKMVEITGLLQGQRLIEVHSIAEIVAPMLPPQSEDPQPKLGEPVQIGVGQTVDFGAAGLTITFLAVTEDSRCPPGSVCIWEGRASISLRLDVASGQSLTFSLTLQAGHPESANAIALGYSFTLQHLESPSQSAGGDASLYEATLVITKANQVDR